RPTDALLGSFLLRSTPMKHIHMQPELIKSIPDTCRRDRVGWRFVGTSSAGHGAGAIASVRSPARPRLTQGQVRDRVPPPARMPFFALESPHPGPVPRSLVLPRSKH